MKAIRLFSSCRFAALCAGLTSLAFAVPQLRVTDGINTVTVTDNAPGDVQDAVGQVLWVGSLGNWLLNVHTGTTYPVIGSATSPVLDLSFNATSSGSGGTLTLSFTQTNFGPTTGSAIAAVGGTTQGTTTYGTYGGVNNTPFNTTQLLTSQGPFTGPAFSGTVTGGSVNNAGPYSLTQVVTITHPAGVTAITTGDALLTVPDSGNSILLLGAGLTTLGLLCRFRRHS